MVLMDLLAQFAEHSRGIPKVMGTTTVQALIFFLQAFS